MKLHGICLVKNEDDFLERAIEHDLGSFDRIYLYDNGSTDGTWDTARRLEARHPGRVVAWKSEDRPFRDDLRAKVFNAFRDRACRGDWWCRLDADEVYADDPRDFLAAVPPSHHVVWAIHLQYYFTEIDLRRWEAPADVARTPAPDFSDLPRHYAANASEPRFFRHRDRLRWESGAWPRHLGLVHPGRIRLRHFQYRSPDQIRKRLATRRSAAESGYADFHHGLDTDWRTKIADASTLHEDRFDGRWVIDESCLPRHLESLPVRAMKRLMHGTGLWP